MIPKKLSIQGLYSYQNEQIINFDELTKTGLFGIFGKVGSGKTTVLEAITFALFEDTERLAKTGDNRWDNMMNLSSDKLKIEFEFIVAKDPDTLYRIVVDSKRKKKTGEVDKFNRQCYRIIGNEISPFDPKELEEIIGLKYEYFNKAVIIPQGKFREFLDLKPTDRTDMLSDIFSLEKYDLQAKANKLLNESKLKCFSLDEKLKGLEEFTEEKLSEVKDNLSQNIKENNELKEQKKQVLEEINKHEKLKELFENLRLAEQKFDDLSEKESYFKELEQQLKQYVRYNSIFRPLLDSESKIKSQLLEEQKVYSEKTALLQTSKEKFASTENAFKVLEEQYAARDEIKQRAEDLGTAAELLKLDGQIPEIAARIENGNAEVQKVVEEYAREKLQKEATEKAAIELKEKFSRLADIHDIDKWFTEKKNIFRQKDEIVDSIKNLDRQKEDVRTIMIKELDELQQGIFTMDIQSLAAAEFESNIAMQTENLKNEQEKLQKTLDSLKVKQKLEHFAEELKPGEKCPLCGSEHHPAPLEQGTTKSDLENAVQESAAAEKKISVLSKMAEKFRLHSARFESILKQIEELATKQALKHEEYDKHRRFFFWNDYDIDDEMAVKRDLKQYKELKIDIDKHDKLAKQAAESLEKLAAQKDKYEAKISDLKADQIRHEERRKNLLGNLKLLKYEQISDSKPESLIAEKDRLTTELASLETNFREKSEQLKELKSIVDKLSGEISTREGHIRSLQQEQQQAEQKTALALENEGCRDIVEVQQVLSRQWDTEKTENDIQKYKNDFAAANNQLDQLKEKSKDMAYKEDAHRELIARDMALNSQISDSDKKIGALEREIESISKSIAQKKDLAKELKSAEKRRDNLNLLYLLFKGKGFVEFISTIYLRDLVHAANKRFMKLTDNRLKLRLDETGRTNRFIVQDMLNGGKYRNIKTLSGGQTFQAAFSLALSLSDIINHSGKKNNFFFIDEGFGTLDSDSLKTVLDTLRALQQDSKIVGVISHVDDLKNDIETYIEVTNTAEHGTIIHQH